MNPYPRTVIMLRKMGNLGVANDVSAWEAQFNGRIIEVEVYLGNIGGTSGSTTVDVKKSTVSILAAPLSIAFNAATKRTRSKAFAAAAAVGEPSGVRFQAGDYIQADVTAIPGTASADLAIYLHVAPDDV